MNTNKNGGGPGARLAKIGLQFIVQLLSYSIKYQISLVAYTITTLSTHKKRENPPQQLDIVMNNKIINNYIQAYFFGLDVVR